MIKVTLRKITRKIGEMIMSKGFSNLIARISDANLNSFFNPSCIRWARHRRHASFVIKYNSFPWNFKVLPLDKLLHIVVNLIWKKLCIFNTYYSNSSLSSQHVSSHVKVWCNIRAVPSTSLSLNKFKQVVVEWSLLIVEWVNKLGKVFERKLWEFKLGVRLKIFCNLCYFTNLTV